MAYNKLTHLTDNIAAIRVAYDLVNTGRERTDADRTILDKYSGFGGLKEIQFMTDIEVIISTTESFDNQLEQIKSLANSNNISTDLMNKVYELNKLLHEIADDDLHYRELRQSLVNSVRTAFYTPQYIIDAIGRALKHLTDVMGVEPKALLEPSAGIGGFLTCAQPGQQTVAFEKDEITATILYARHPESEVYADGFETIDRQCPLGQPADEFEDPRRFDLCVSNIPFNKDLGVDDPSFNCDEVHRTARRMLHTYFFAKGIEVVEDGGIVCFITTRGIADSQTHQYLREWMTERAILIAALRLPDNLFVDGSGIEVGTDLLVFQKMNGKQWQSLQEQYFAQTINKTIDGREVKGINRLMACKSMCVGDRKVSSNRYGEQQPVYKWHGTDEELAIELEQRLTQQMEQNFLRAVWDFGHDEERKTAAANARRKDSDRRKRRSAAATATRKKNQELAEQMRPAFDDIVGVYKELVQYEKVEKKENFKLRAELNWRYDEFVQTFGTMHKNQLALEFLTDAAIALSLERRETNGEYVKADVFEKPISFRKVTPGECTPVEALALSLNEYGRCNMDYMKQILLMDEDEIAIALEGHIYLTNEGWQHKSHALCGNVIKKRHELERKLAETNDIPTRQYLQKTIDALRSVTPKAIPYEDITIQMGSRWIPCEYYEAFARKIFKLYGWMDLSIKYEPQTDKYMINNYGNTCDGSQHGRWAARTSRKTYSGWEVFSFAMADACPKIMRTLDNDDKVPDEEAIRIVRNKTDDIRREFENYMRTELTAEQKSFLALIYNERYNCLVRAKYDGSHQTFPGLDFSQLGFSDLYQSQKDMIFAIKSLHGGICWYEVGGGKSMIMIVAAMEMKRLGLVNKPMIIAMKANVGQIAETFRKAYPNAKLCFPTGKDMSGENSKEFMSQIANNDWDCVIMSHNQFERIPISESARRKIMQDELDEAQAAYDEMMKNEDTGDKDWRRVKSQLSNEIEKLRNEINKINRALEERSADVMDFSSLNVDFLFVDEYHCYKNLHFATRHKRVKGIGDTTIKGKTQALLTAIRDIQARRGTDMCAAFFSGTVVSNALTELYVAFKYLRPNALREQGIHCFDAWASIFAVKSTNYDLTITNQLTSQEKFRGYKNVPEMTMFLREICDYKTASMMNLDVPDMNVVENFADPTPEQSVMLERLVKFAKSGRYNDLGLTYNKPPKNCSDAKMLIATDIARKVALDPRILSDIQFSDHSNNKVHRCANELFQRYVKYDEHRGIQFVFSDFSVYDPKKWNICAAIRDVLVDTYGIPTEEITFIQMWNTDKKKMQLFDKLNKGEIRIIFGSTQTLGTGVNAQERAVAVHHLDLPWRPSDIDQRNGRAIRKGNTVKIWGDNKVDIIFYGTNRTLDGYQFCTLKNKSMFIKQICSDDLASRNCSEDDMDDDSGMNYAEYVALLSGNQDLLEMTRIDAQIKNFESDQLNHQREVDSALTQQNKAKLDLEEKQRVIDATRPAIAAISRVMDGIEDTPDKDTDHKQLLPSFHLNGLTDEEHTFAGIAKYLQDMRRDESCQGARIIGTFRGMDIICELYMEQGQANNVFKLRDPMGLSWKVTVDGHLSAASYAATVGAFYGITSAMQQIIDRNTLAITALREKILQLDSVVNSEWTGEAHLAELRTKRDAVQARIDAALAADKKAQEDALSANSNL